MLMKRNGETYAARSKVTVVLNPSVATKLQSLSAPDRYTVAISITTYVGKKRLKESPTRTQNSMILKI